MFSASLYDKLSEEEREILQKYSDRVNQCQAKIKSDVQQPRLESESPQPLAVLQTHHFIESGPERSQGRDEEKVLEESKQFEEEEEVQSRSPKLLGLTQGKVSRQRSTEGTPRKGQYAEDTFNSRLRHNSTSRSPSRKEEKKHRTKSRLNLKLVPNFESEVEKLLRIISHFSRKSSNLRELLLSESPLFRRYFLSQSHA